MFFFGLDWQFFSVFLWSIRFGLVCIVELSSYLSVLYSMLIVSGLNLIP